MCTASWIVDSEGLELFFNRDERRTREEGEPPRLHRHEGVRLLSPRDPTGGGTWIFVNELGLASVILNRYDREWTPGPAGERSRGRLLFESASAGDPEAFGRRVEAAVRKDPYAPCFLLALQPGRDPALWGWDGRTLERQATPPAPPLTTAGPESARLSDLRTAGFHRMRKAEGGRLTAELLERFHRGEDPADPAASVCLSRPEAWTVSRARIQVDPSSVRMSYWARLPDGSFATPIDRGMERKGAPPQG